MTERQGAGQAHGDGTSSALSPKYAALLRRLQEIQQEVEKDAKDQQDMVAAIEFLVADQRDIEKDAKEKNHQDMVAAQRLLAASEKHGVDGVVLLRFLCGAEDTGPHHKEIIKELIDWIAKGVEAPLLAGAVEDALVGALRRGKPFRDLYPGMYRKRFGLPKRPLKRLNSTHPAPLEATLDCARCGVKPDPSRGAERRLACAVELAQRGAPGRNSGAPAESREPVPV